MFKGEPTLFIIDDCSATKALTNKKDMLSELPFSGQIDCDELIDELMSIADPQGQRQDAGLAERAPPAAAPAATPDAPEEEGREQKHRERLAAIAAGGHSRAVRTGGPWESIHRRSNRRSGQ